MEELEVMGSEGELSSGYKLVPWSSWDQWDFVREHLFSPSPDSVAAALRRISAWRSRGSLPIPIDVTAAFVEAQQKDPFFRKGPEDDALTSEEMLASLYSMAIMRLVNCYVEHAHKKTGRSISELADAVGIPRVLVDIRHESSHRDLPSLRLVRLASMKALDWLKSNYWEPQKNAIPDVRVEIRTRLREMAYYLKIKNVKKSSLEIKGNRSGKQISRTVKIITRLYATYSLEVISVLLELFQSQAPDIFGAGPMQHSENPDNGDSRFLAISNNSLKTIITKLSSKEPRLLLSLLKVVLEKIEAIESLRSKNEESHVLPFQYQTEPSQVNHLCSLVSWLVTKLKASKDSGDISLINENGALSSDKNAVPKFSLQKLLRKCLTLSFLGDEYLADSVSMLLDMIEDDTQKEKLKKLILLRLQNWPTEDPLLLKEDDSIKKAAEKLEFLKQRLEKRRLKNLGSLNCDTGEASIWTVAKSWVPCPIGMVPCSFSSTAVLPILDLVDDNRLEEKTIPTDDLQLVDNHHDNDGGDSDSHDEPLLSNGRAAKKLRPSPEKVHIINLRQSPDPIEGRLLINGAWVKVSKEELVSIVTTLRSGV
ncbi:Ribosomal biogenesis protein LAS1L [Ananas comosus]|uniref:Ribosomal biogenesis protein LAS1L n=1 Tax=Ananas comosus TaxID=4615 RepID=A0A199VCT0_ANACO|nr:Ribosomal biogenesis protein LAS1L [Ananas comosus]